MKTISSTELARNLKKILDTVEHKGQTVVVVRNGQKIAKITASPAHMDALEAMSDLYRTLPEDAAKDWVKESKSNEGYLSDEIEDPWRAR